jgi:hypothetical protein
MWLYAMELALHDIATHAQEIRRRLVAHRAHHCRCSSETALPFLWVRMRMIS